MTNPHGNDASKRHDAQHQVSLGGYALADSDLSISQQTNPLLAPMVKVERRHAANMASNVAVPRLEAMDFEGGDGFLAFMTRLEHDNPAWFDDFTRVNAGLFNIAEMTEVMLQAPHPFLQGMVYGKLLERMAPRVFSRPRPPT